MKFDDRLATAMRIGASGPAMRRVELRQLIDLLGTSPPHLQSAAVEAAYDRIAKLGLEIPVAERAAIIAERGLRLRSPRLVALLATGEQGVAEAAVQRAELSPEEWLDLIPALPAGARQALRQRSDLPARVLDRLTASGTYGVGLPPAKADIAEPGNEQIDAQAPGPATASASEAAPPIARLPASRDQGQPATSISDLVRRIEAYRHARQGQGASQAAAETEAPQLPLGDKAADSLLLAGAAIDFSTDPAGTICWADSQAASMLVGLAPFAPLPNAAKLRQRRPILGQTIYLNGAGTIEGPWQVDATPRFAPGSGNFLGYLGRLRRIAPDQGAEATARESEGDRIRQLLHELRTPVNAIQGFAEVIQQQLFGATPHEYRALAATIAGDAARILAALEELERLARLETGVLQLEQGEADLADAVRAVAIQLHERIAQRKVSLDLPEDLIPVPSSLSIAEAQLLAWRLLATLAGAAMPGETLKISSGKISSGKISSGWSGTAGAGRELCIDLPASLRDKPEESILHAAVGAVPQALAAGMFGVGFALRLARAELRAVGGELSTDGKRLKLRLPDLTGNGLGHSAQQLA